MNRHLTHQDELPFVRTNNAGIVVENCSCSDGVFPPKRFEAGGLAKELPATEHQLKVQARVVEYLKLHGGIDVLTVQKLGTTSGHKLLSRLRDKGYLHPANDPAGFISYPNASGQGTYRWHRWTGKQ